MFAENAAGNFIYADSMVEESKIKLLWWQAQGLAETASGYGRKLTTCHMVKIENKWHRVYCVCFSNVGTCYIEKNGLKYILQNV